MKSPAREATAQVPVGLMAPAGKSVLTPLGDKGCATVGAVTTARSPIAPTVDLNMAYLSARLYPRPRCLGLLLEARDLVLLDQRETDIIEAVEQAVLAMWVDFKLDHAAVGT